VSFTAGNQKSLYRSYRGVIVDIEESIMRTLNNSPGREGEKEGKISHGCEVLLPKVIYLKG